ncbi:MAG: 50S ribosomal protein L3 [Candidatus Babeliaceae bacterium]|nr:50S ribosomal protein L3 [Candidatus Babeliaceae bacterium]
MLSGLWGKKIGMTQVFSDDHQVVPVTVIDVGDWFVTQVKAEERDGYNAVQFGCLRPRHRGKEFSADWIKAPKDYFSVLREVRVLDATSAAQFAVGQTADVTAVLGAGDVVDVLGVTVGKGFQGVIKRHGHSGGRGSHGDKLGRAPGSLTGMRTCGRVHKGRKLPGHMGARNKSVKNIEVVRVDPEVRMVLVKGSVPGKADSFVFIRKCR